MFLTEVFKTDIFYFGFTGFKYVNKNGHCIYIREIKMAEHMNQTPSRRNTRGMFYFLFHIVLYQNTKFKPILSDINGAST
jgi:hypothetical protein